MNAQTAESGANPKNVVQSFAKGFRVLEAFSARDPELSLTDVVARTGLDKGTVFRLLNTLVMLGYVERVPGSRRFRLTLKILDLGFNAIARADLRQIARPVLRSLVGEINEAASLGVLDGTDVVYIERVEAGLARLGTDIRIGTRIPAHATVIGHAILSCLTDDEQTALLEASDLKRLTPNTLVDIDALKAMLREVRVRGYAGTDRAMTGALRVLAAPVIDADGQPIAAISVAAPIFRTEETDFLTRSREPLLAAAAQISRAMQAGGGWSARIS